MTISFAVFIARLAAFCLTREAFSAVRQAPTAVPLSYMSELTPELVAQWEAKLQDPNQLTSGERYGLECKISALEATLTSQASDIVKNIARKQLEALVCRLEAYSEPVPVEPSTMPKWNSKFTDYTGIDAGALEVAHAHLLERIKKAHLAIRKVSHNYNVRTELIKAGVWDWRNPLLKCAPKGTLKAYYARLREIRSEAVTLEFAIDAAERAEGREIPDSITQWNTSGLAGPAGGEDMRRFPVLKGNLEWADILDMAKPVKVLAPEVVKGRQEAYRWHCRVNGVKFIAPATEEVQVGF